MSDDLKRIIGLAETVEKEFNTYAKSVTGMKRNSVAQTLFAIRWSLMEMRELDNKESKPTRLGRFAKVL